MHEIFARLLSRIHSSTPQIRIHITTEIKQTNHISSLIKYLGFASRLKEFCKQLLQNPKCMQLSQSLLFDKYTYSFCTIGLQFVLSSLLLCLANSHADSTSQNHFIIRQHQLQASITRNGRSPVTGDCRHSLNLAPSTCHLLGAKRLETGLNRDKTECQRWAIFSGRRRQRRAICITEDSTWKNRVDSSARSSLLASQKVG